MQSCPNWGIIWAFTMADWKTQETWLTIMLIFETESMWRLLEKFYSCTNWLAPLKSFIPSPTNKHTRFIQKVSKYRFTVKIYHIRFCIKFYCYQILHSSTIFPHIRRHYWGTYRSGAQFFVYPPHRMWPPAMLATSALHLSGHRRRQIAYRPGNSLGVGRG